MEEKKVVFKLLSKCDNFDAIDNFDDHDGDKILFTVENYHKN